MLLLIQLLADFSRKAALDGPDALDFLTHTGDSDGIAGSLLQLQLFGGMN